MVLYGAYARGYDHRGNPDAVNEYRVIMDAVPRPDGTNDIEEKLKTFHQHVLKMKKAAAAAASNSNPMFRRIGYEMWFVTDGDSDKLAKHIEQANASTSMLKDTYVNHHFFSKKEEFIDHTLSYLANVYLKMYRGM